jgi:hypothetical protein
MVQDTPKGTNLALYEGADDADEWRAAGEPRGIDPGVGAGRL